ncbi:hypothetical protein [Microbacterium hominis]|uniref:Uncharacterized protein n=1 Tax=Microbacterium hominis TaxID=162426 RepID=A0A7D4PSG8_9MICO|nr:hypothetical protein [Microbacterium hominis]QKJ18053.1 hypothetical protein HQM25_00555 [Microbacterium hominis]
MTWNQPNRHLPDKQCDRNESQADSYQRDGSGLFESFAESVDASHFTTEQGSHSFDRDGVLTSETHSLLVRFDTNTHDTTRVEVTVTPQGMRTEHTWITDAEGHVWLDDTLVTYVPPLVEARRKAPPRRPPTRPDTTPPGKGPQPRGTSGGSAGSGGGGGGGGFQPFPRAISAPNGQCEHFTDYYLAATAARDETYLGTVFEGVGPCT